MNCSYILPFYKKAELFRLTLSVNDCFRSNDVEVVLVLDEPTQEGHIMETVRENPGIKFRVIVNDWPHEWRPPCMAYNIGIRHSLAQHVVLTDPESVIVLPSLDFVQKLIREDFRMCYAGLTWMELDIKAGDPPDLIQHKLQVCEAVQKVWLWGFGFLLVPKIALERLCGFDEQRLSYGYDDNDIRVRLARLGNRCVIDGRIKIFHIHHGDTKRMMTEELPGPGIALVEQKECWGKAYSRIAYDWNSAK